MRDKKKGTKDPEAHDDRRDKTMPDCCGTMAERVLRAFGATQEDALKCESAQHSGTDWVLSCASMMERMAPRCCGPTSREEEAKE